VASAEKILERMRNSPRDWRIEDLKRIADRCGIGYVQKGTSHVTFRHPAATKVTVPAARPVQPVYVKQFLAMIEAVKGATKKQ
jgi:predicted RNA binding protein YcfA (HicA-like mRNA interferase family)